MIRAPHVAPRYICKACGAESPRGIGYVVGIVGPLPAPDPACRERHALDVVSAVVCHSCGRALIRGESGGWYHEGTGLAGWVDDPTDAAHRALPMPGIPGCCCAHHADGSTTTTLCPIHADRDPCLTMSLVTGRRRTGTIRRGVCSACGHGARRLVR